MDPAQNQPQPIVTPSVEDHSAPPPPPPVNAPPPAPLSTPPPPPPPGMPSNPKVKWGKSALIGSAVLVALLVVGLAVGTFLNSRREPTRVQTQAEGTWCSPDPFLHDYGNPCSTRGAIDCGGDGRQTVCGHPDNPSSFTWHATGQCCGSAPTPGSGGMSCLTIRDGQQGPPLEIRVNNNSTENRSYQLQKCTCADGALPCNTCDFSLPGLVSGGEITESMGAISCGSIQLDVSPVDGEFGSCFAWYSTGVPCSPTTTPRPVCTSMTLTPNSLSVGQTTTATATSDIPVNTFAFALYNIDRPLPDGSPGPLCVTTGGDNTSVTNNCPAGSHHLIYHDPVTTSRTSGSRILTYANIFVADQADGGAVAQRVQINSYLTVTGGQTSAGTATCALPITIASVPTMTPTLTPTPTTPGSPTATPTTPATAQCQQVQLFRDATQITSADILLGDTITFRGFATAIGGVVSDIRYTIVKGGVTSTVDVPATLQGANYVANHVIEIDTATSYSVTTAPILQ